MFNRESSKRGNNYFIGEIFAISRELIPNSQRAYFKENPVRIDFEHKLKDYFNNTLYFIYYEGSDINSSIKKINSYAEKVSEFKKKVQEGGFLSDEERIREQSELEAKKLDAEKAQQNLEKKKEGGGRSILTPQILSAELKRSTAVPPSEPPKT
jgi:molecular chaperone HtpG